MTDEYQHENRADLEQRFLIMATFATRAREMSAFCMDRECKSCIALRDAIPIPATVLAASQEPREDLEEAVVSINDRFETVVELPRNGCPGQNFLVSLLTEATDRLEGDA